MAGIWKTQHNYEGYTINMLKKKGLQAVYPSINGIRSKDMDIYKTNGKDIVCSTTQHGTKHA